MPNHADLPGLAPLSGPEVADRSLDEVRLGVEDVDLNPVAEHLLDRRELPVELVAHVDGIGV